MKRPLLLPPAVLLARLVSPRWRWMTLAALFTCAVMVGLGFWQLNRLAGRRALSAELASRLSLPPVTLTAASVQTPEQLEFRLVAADGVFDHATEVGLVNQVWDGRLGVHLLTPLVLAGSDRAVLVDRGWIPLEDASPAAWSRFRTAGPVHVVGWLRLSRPARGAVFSGVPGQERLVSAADVAQLSGPLRHPLLPVIVVQAPDVATTTAAVSAPGSQPLPYRQPPVTDLGDGVHLIAATQWFLIGGIVLIGLGIYVTRHEAERKQ